MDDELVRNDVLFGHYIQLISSNTMASYPETKKEDVVDNHHGTDVPDPYRWLEEVNADETRDWVRRQQKCTEAFLEEAPFRDDLRERLRTLKNYPRIHGMRKEGGRYFFFRNEGLQEQPVFCVQEDRDGEPEVFLDPNRFSDEGQVSIDQVSFSRNGDYCAYTRTRSGTDWTTIRVVEVSSRAHLEDQLNWVKTMSIAWRGDGFYYSRFPEPEEEALTEQNVNAKIYYHELGTDQSTDRLVFEDPDHPRRFFYPSTTEDEEFLFVYEAGPEGKGNRVFYRRAGSPDADFRRPLESHEHTIYLVGKTGSDLLFYTNRNADNFKVVRTPVDRPAPDHWEDLVPEGDRPLEKAVLAGGHLFLKFQEDGEDRLYRHDLEGNRETEVSLPEHGSVRSLSGKQNQDELFYSFSSYTVPSRVYGYSVSSGEASVLHDPDVPFDVEQYETSLEFYESKDGTRVPIFLVYGKHRTPSEQTPALMTGYGGFRNSVTPGYNSSYSLWLEQGGLLAFPGIRGGNEYGESWHEAGMRERKQNVFDDFIAGAEYLVENNYTSPERLAISGGSNGGLLVGACMVQRPDLFAVVLASRGVFDMLRFHEFTVGHAWVSEYGSPEDPDDFEYLYDYSPLHNLEETEYPAVLLTTADHDDRVVPAHSYKFAATLQEKQEGEEPVLLRVETETGHGAGTDTSKEIEESADRIAFALSRMGYDELPGS